MRCAQFFRTHSRTHFVASSRRSFRIWPRIWSAISRFDARGSGINFARAQRQQHFIRIGFKAGLRLAHQIRHHHVAVLRLPVSGALLRADSPSRRRSRSAAGRRACAQVRPEYPASDPVPAKSRADVFLIFCFDSTERPEIGHGRALDHHRRRLQIREHRIAHFGRRPHLNHFRAPRRIRAPPDRSPESPARPRSIAACASAYPILPLDRLER